MKYSAGSFVKIKTKDSEYQGTILPSSTSETVFLKLNNGYNAGFSAKSIKSMSVLKSSEIQKPKSKITSQNPKLPKISFITTGGTIASRVDYKTGAVAPLTKPDDILSAVPELRKKVNISKIVSPFSIFSEDMTYKEWQKLATFAAKKALLGEKLI